MVEQGGNNPDGTGIVFDAAGLPNTAPSARDRQKSRAAQVSQDEEGGRTSGGRESVLRRHSVLDGEKIQSPKFVYDVKALRDNTRIIVQRGALLRKADFRSPSGKLKLLGPDLDRIIPLLRAGELSFRLEEEVIGSSAEQKMADGDEVTMAELSAPARLVDAHAVRRSWLLKGQHLLDNTGHHNIYFKVLLHMHPALGD
ncbi:BZ3500_MvSof-1268-A1-R1_Chr8-1g10042 [Microbotryum saponariae]|uniref:BZ3500_MvSof-1268-A1-R1_Chr8-1g10042 protein n=1 Tax=Microbotryum saponariae TaxID=289078 RepID=A0A2X0KT67_9BASI|nr:BZ3500_MvSof-1268-A1-R1_Chr8-1g10042 [Microbotryum saponariae]SDA08328.1 BZ3501_MvSof-1269-A2-R1_Chr8-1g09765 [Microbotryum saponariae]